MPSTGQAPNQGVSPVVVFRAGAVGLSAIRGYQRKGADHIVVVDIVALRLDQALRVGANAVVNWAEVDDLAGKLVELQGAEIAPFR